MIKTNIDKDTDILMPMYDSIEYIDNYSKTSVSLWHYDRDEPILDNGAIADFPASNNNSASFKFKTKQRAEQGTMAQKM